MTFDPKKHHRRSIRLKHYDYSAIGAYFVTICTYKRQCWFGDIKNGQMHLNQIGKIVAQEWLRTPEIRPNFQLDEWIIMPNHLHGIVIISENLNGNANNELGASIAPLRPNQLDASIAPLRPNQLGASIAPLRRKPHSLSSFVAGFKSAVTKRINLIRQTSEMPIWQRNYYESIIRDDRYLMAIQEYIINNPYNWDKDSDNPQNYQHTEELTLDLFF